MRITTAVGEMWLEDGVLWHRIDDILVSKEEATDVATAIRKMTGGKPTPAIVDIRSIGYAKQEVRDLFASLPEDAGEVATALIVGSTASRTMAKLFMDYSTPNRPIQVFNSPVAALEWARSFLPDPD